MRNVTISVADRKQLKHKSRLYDLPRTDNEVDINEIDIKMILIIIQNNYPVLLTT